MLHSLATEPEPSNFLTSRCFSARSTANAEFATLLGGDRAFALSSLTTRRSFSSGFKAFFFFAGLALVFDDFLRAFVDLAFVLGLGLDLDFALGFVFFVAGLLVAAPDSTPVAGAVVLAVALAVVLAVAVFFLGALVVRPV